MSAARAFFHSAAALALGLSLGAAQAQGYPAKPISLIVPFSAGGGVDATARLLTAKLGELLKQPVVIENVAGAAGTIGTQKAARSPADGYTLLFAVASPLNVAPLVAPSAVRYDTFKDFVPVATVGTSPFVLIGKPALPARTAGELIQLAKAQPGKLNFGTDGAPRCTSRPRCSSSAPASTSCMCPTSRDRRCSPTSRAARSIWRCCRSRWRSLSSGTAR